MQKVVCKTSSFTNRTIVFVHIFFKGSTSDIFWVLYSCIYIYFAHKTCKFVNGHNCDW